MSGDKRKEVMLQLQDIFRDVFDDDDLVITEESSAADIDEWDSLMHISLIVAAEKKFDLRLDAAKIASFANVGGMIDVLVEGKSM